MASMSNGMTGKIINEKRSFGVWILENIFEAFPDLNPEWLLLGRGEMLRVTEYGDTLDEDASKLAEPDDPQYNEAQTIEKLKAENHALKKENDILKARYNALLEAFKEIGGKQ